MHRLLTTLLACVLAARAADEFSPESYSADNVIHADVAIIGGGSAGSYSAVRLVDHGLSVAVVEPKGQLGGHAETYVDPSSGATVDIGVVVFEPFPLTTEYFARFDVPLMPYSNVVFNPTEYVNFNTGRVVDWEPPSNAEAGPALMAYREQLTRHPDIASGYDLSYPVNEDLLLPFGKFIEKYQLGGAARAIYQFQQGYSPYLDLPALYVMKQFGLGLFDAVMSNSLVTTTNRNTHELYERIGEFLGDKQVLLDTSVVSMSRGEEGSQGPRVVVDGPGGKQLIVARKVLVTAPLANVYDARDRFDLDTEESGLFQQFFGNGYYTGLIKNTGLPANFSATGADPAQPYAVPPLPGLYIIYEAADLPGVFHVYYGVSRPVPGEAVQREIEAIVGRMQVARGLPASTPEWLVFSDHTPYNSMVKPEAIRGGFYKNLLGLQGKRDTFYSGATWETHDSSMIWNYTEEHVLPELLASLH